MRANFTLLFALLIPLATCGAQPKRELIFQPGSQPFASSHASTLVELSSGNLMAAWFGGTAEGEPDVAIWGAIRAGNNWSTPVELAREPHVPCWNPVLFHTPRALHTKNKRLWLYYKFGPSPETWTAARKYSDDEGSTWSAAEHLPAGLVGPVRAKPLVLSDGTIVAGSSTESYTSWAVRIERSSDGGSTWARIGPIVLPPKLDSKAAEEVSAAQNPNPGDSPQRRGLIQPSVVSLGGAHLRLYARSTTETARICIADSYDNGLTWTHARTIDVPNPNSGIDVVALKDGRLVLIYNNTITGRTPLNLAVSTDGEHFRMFSTLEDKPGEYSYPAIIQTSTGDLEITYTWERRSIAHVHVPLADIPK